MTGRVPFLARLAEGPIVFDGAMATMLRGAGWPEDHPVELANIEAPALVRKIHEAYRTAGAQVLTANTFGAHELRAGLLLLADRVEEVCATAVALAREAAAPDGYVAASIGPPGDPIFPLGDRSYRIAIGAYRRQFAACRAGGADLFILESFTDLLELQAALTAAREERVGPVAVSMALQPARLAAGLVSPEALAEVAQALGADLIGINCMPAADVARAVERMIVRARTPIFVQPAAGGGDTGGESRTGLEEFGGWATRLLALGVRGLGGCCGTTPAHVEAVVRVLSGGPTDPRGSRRTSP